ncbi:MAG: adenylate/guanylate cyclase domain-containing protein [Croceibacterium sp.]
MTQSEQLARLTGEADMPIDPAKEDILRPGVFSRFSNDATEAHYQEKARTLRTPFVRLYGVLFMLVALGYSLIDPLFLEPDESGRLALLLGAALLVGGIYVSLTFWKEYARYPMIDFVALLVLSLVVMRFDYIISGHISRFHEPIGVDLGIINRLVLTAFAAVTLAGRPRLFLIWLGFEMLGWHMAVLSDLRHSVAIAYAMLSYLSGSMIMFAINLAIGRTSRAAFALAEGFDLERSKNEELVFNMLPPKAVERIRDGRVVADSFADASVIFIDMVDFSSLAKRMSPGHLVELLNGFFGHADRCAAEFGVEKVKTVGDSYLAIAGGNVASGNSADTAIAFASAVIAGVEELRRSSGVDAVGLRAGIHSGPVVGGVIGETRMAYDYWGDTVNIAARMEATAPVNGVALSESTWLRARDGHAFGAPETMTLKGVGEMAVYRAVIDPPAAEDKPIAA